MQVRSQGRLLLDPSAQEAAAADASVLVSIMPSLNEVTQLCVTGSWGRSAGGAGSTPSLQQALQLGLGACMQLREEMRATLLAKMAPPQLSQPPASGEAAAGPPGN
jgi:exosome complex component MTR3